MQYDVETPEEYLAALEHDWRRVALLAVRSLIQEVGPELREGIGYKMLRYSDAHGPVLHLNAQKAFVGLYPGDLDALDPDGDLTGGFSRGKGCLRLRKSTDLADPRLRAILERVMERRRSGESRVC